MPRPNKNLFDKPQEVSADEGLSRDERASRDRSRVEVFKAFESSISSLRALADGESADHRHVCKDCSKQLLSKADASLMHSMMKALLPYVQRQQSQLLEVRHTHAVEKTSNLKAGFFSVVEQLPDEVLLPLGHRIAEMVGGRLILNEAQRLLDSVPVEAEVVEEDA